VHASMTACVRRDIKASERDDTDEQPCVRKRSECGETGATVFLFGFPYRRAVS
jgi:hypothetical protein